MAEPIMDQYAKISAYDVHSYQVRCTFGTSTNMTYRSRDAIPTRPSATTVKITLPKVYGEIVGFQVGRKAAASVAGLEWIITTDNVATDGTLTLTSIVTGGTATAPASGDVAYFNISVSSDVLNDRFTG